MEGKYNKSQIIPFDYGTVIYWIEYPDGTTKYILRENIPIGTEVMDADTGKIEVIK